MKVLVRDELKKLYLGRSGTWVLDPDEAQDFVSLQTAGERARADPESDLSVVLSYENPCCELALNPVYCV